MRDGRFFHAVWLCSVCILPAGRRMWDTLFLHGEAFRALAAATDGSAKRRRAVAQTEGPGLVPSLLYSTIWRQVRYVRICWCGVVSLRGDPPSRTASFPYVCGYVVRQGYRDAVTVPLSEMWGGRQPFHKHQLWLLPLVSLDFLQAFLLFCNYKSFVMHRNHSLHRILHFHNAHLTH